MAADDDKKLILARRARFVAAALAGVSVACGKEPTPPPQPCLSVPMTRADAEAEPMPCLSPVAVDPDAAPPSDAGIPIEEPDAGRPDAAKPMPCLTPVAPNTAAPKPCLSVRRVDPKTQK